MGVVLLQRTQLVLGKRKRQRRVEQFCQGIGQGIG